MRALFLIVALLGVSHGQEYFREPEKILSASHNVGDDLGSYAFTYETEGGILQKEQGSRKYAGTDNEAQLIQGSVQYNAPDGTPVSLSWTADEFGAQVSGSHLPTPPPIPPEIQRALDWIAKQPSTTEEPENDKYEKKKLSRDFSGPSPKVLLKSQQFENLKKPTNRN